MPLRVAHWRGRHPVDRFTVYAVVLTVLVVAVAAALPGVYLHSLFAVALIIPAIVFANGQVRWILLALRMPRSWWLLAPAYLLANVVVFSLLGGVVPGFVVANWGSSVLAGLLVSPASLVLEWGYRERHHGPYGEVDAGRGAA